MPVIPDEDNNWALEKMTEILEDAFGKFDAKNFEKILKNIEKNIKDGGGGGGGPKSKSKADKDAKKAKEENIEATKKSSTGFFAIDVALSVASAGLSVFTAAIGSLGSYVGNSIDVYRELVGVGQTFSGSIYEMRRQVTEAHMDFETFGKVMSAHSKIIKAVGTPAFIALQNEVRRINSGFGQFGFTIEESAAITADYSERQLRAGRFESLTNTQRALETQKYMFQLSKLSEITGRSRKEMMKDMEATSQNVDIRMAAGSLDEKARKRFRKGIELMGPSLAAMGSEFNGAITNMIAQGVKFGNIGLSDFGQVATVVGGDFLKASEGLIEAVMNGESGGKHLAKIFNELSDRGSDAYQTINRMSIAGHEGANKIMDMVRSIENMSPKQIAEFQEQVGLSDTALKSLMEKQKAAADEEKKQTQDMLDIQNKWQTAMSEIHGMILDKLIPVFKDLFGAIEPIITGKLFPILKEIFKDLSEKVGGFLKDVDWDQVGKDIANFISVTIPALIRAFGWVIDKLSWFFGEEEKPDHTGMVRTRMGWKQKPEASDVSGSAAAGGFRARGRSALSSDRIPSVDTNKITVVKSEETGWERVGGPRGGRWRRKEEADDETGAVATPGNISERQLAATEEGNKIAAEGNDITRAQLTETNRLRKAVINSPGGISGTPF